MKLLLMFMFKANIIIKGKVVEQKEGLWSECNVVDDINRVHYMGLVLEDIIGKNVEITIREV